MAKRVGAAHAKAHFSALMAEVAYGQERVIIERRGRPLAVLVGLSDLERLERGETTSTEPRGALALVGAWSALEDQELDALIADIYAQRERDIARPVVLPD
jgi:prevent-host-death family protein